MMGTKGADKVKDTYVYDKARGKWKPVSPPSSPPVINRKRVVKQSASPALAPLPARPAVTLSSLPKELLIKIALHLDRPGALAYALVCRSAVLAADHRIWRELDLSLSEHYGEYPLVQLHDRNDTRVHYAWAAARAKEAEERHRTGLREKARTIMMRSDERRCGLVHSVTLMPRPTAVSAQVMLLELLSPTLQRLNIIAPVEHVMADQWRPTDDQTLDVKLLEGGLSFASLSYLKLDKGAVSYLWMVTLLCEAAPALQTLDIDISSVGETTLSLSGTGQTRRTQAFSSNLQLDRLRIVFLGDRHSGSTPSFVRRLLRKCTRLEQLVLFDVSRQDNCQGLSLESLADQSTTLRHLSWNISLDNFKQLMHPYAPRCGGASDALWRLERLVLNADASFDLNLAIYIPPLKSLKHLYLRERQAPSGSLFTADAAQPRVARVLRADLAKKYGGHRGTRTVTFVPGYNVESTLDCFAELEAAPTSTSSIGQHDCMTISSYHHRGEELLYVRILSALIEILDVTTEGSNQIASGGDTGITSIPYDAADGSRRVKLVAKTKQRMWQEYTDFQGLRVPLGVLDQMRRKQAVTAKEWQDRYEDVGRKAWKVLTRWRKRTTKMEADREDNEVEEDDDGASSGSESLLF